MSFGSSARFFIGVSVPLVVLAASCKMLKNSSEVDGAGGAIPFSRFCPSSKLSNCDARPEDVGAKQREWEVGFDVFKEVLNSPTTIQLTRKEFELKVVRSTFDTFGASSLMGFITRIPWKSLEASTGNITLVNSGASQSVVVNGLTLIADQKTVLKTGLSRSLSVTGLKIANAAGGDVQTVLSLDFSRTGSMTIVTDKQQITDFPITFFVMKELVKKVDVTASTVVKTITNLATDPSFDWRNRIVILLNNRNLTKIMDIMNEVVPESSSFGSTIDTVVRKSQRVLFGGASSVLVSGSLSAPVACQMTFVNIPLLGTKNVGLNFASTFGVTDLRKNGDGTLSARMYGVSTGAGPVSDLTIVGTKLKVKIGPFTLPLDLEAQVKGDGMSLKKVSCN